MADRSYSWRASPFFESQFAALMQVGDTVAVQPFVEDIQNSHDDAPLLVFADWLEERGDKRGHYIRDVCRLALGAERPFTPTLHRVTEFDRSGDRSPRHSYNVAGPYTVITVNSRRMGELLELFDIALRQGKAIALVVDLRHCGRLRSPLIELLINLHFEVERLNGQVIMVTGRELALDKMEFFARGDTFNFADNVDEAVSMME